MGVGGGYWLRRSTLKLLFIGMVAVCMSVFQGCANNECQDALDALSENRKAYYANTTGLWLSPARTMEELVDEADVIVIGTADCVVGVANQSPYEADKTCRGEFDYPSPHPAQPHVGYLINVEKVILDDGTISGGKPLLMRLGGRWQAGSSNPAFEGMPTPGDRRLFALAKEPNGSIHGMRSLWNQFLVDGENVTYSDVLRTPACLAGKMNTENFIQALEDVTEEKNKP